MAIKLSDRIKRWMPFPTLGETPPTVAMAHSLTDRYKFMDLMRIRAFDPDLHMAVLDDGQKLSAGFAYEVVPLLAAGSDAERQIASMLKGLPSGSVAQTGTLGWPDTYLEMSNWAKARSAQAPAQIMKDMAVGRLRHFEKAERDKSLILEGRLHPRNYRSFFFITIPGIDHDADAWVIQRFFREAERLSISLNAQLNSVGLQPTMMSEFEVLRVFRQMVNPSMGAAELDSEILKTDEHGRVVTRPRLPQDVMSKRARMRVDPGGDLMFSHSLDRGGISRDTACRCITVDTYPHTHQLFDQRRLIGEMLDGMSRISAPFYAYTNVVILDEQNARDKLTQTMGMMNKQALSDSAWFRSMMGHMFDRLEETKEVLSLTSSEQSLVRAYTGINVFGDAEDIETLADAASGLWNKSGFQCSREAYLTLPIFMASMPFGYVPDLDPPNRGLQRAEMMSTLNAASLSFVASDWKGTPAQRGGPLLLSRRGQVASIDLFSSETNYNFAVAAESGAGKSFFANEIIMDFLSRNGIVRTMDVGRSYQNLCNLMNGQIIEYDINNPRSINPFWGISNRSELGELLPMLKAMVTIMAYPRHSPPPWHYQAIENVLSAVWEKCNAEMGAEDVYRGFKGHEDPRAQDIADQLEPYAIGRLAAWFNGEPEIKLEGDFTILELDGLNADKELRNVVLVQSIHSIMHDMYLSDLEMKKRPKLLLIDEAWDLLKDDNDSKTAAEFIETAARRIRKYYGSLGTITQSYKDYTQSSAASAALSNSAWRFTLSQDAGSLQNARENAVFPADNDLLWKMLATVKSGSGYSEIHVSNGRIGETYRFIVDPLSYWIYSTNPRDRAEIEHLAASRNISHLEAIRMLAQDAIDKEKAKAHAA